MPDNRRGAYFVSLDLPSDVPDRELEVFIRQAMTLKACSSHPSSGLTALGQSRLRVVQASSVTVDQLRALYPHLTISLASETPPRGG